MRNAHLMVQDGPTHLLVPVTLQPVPTDELAERRRILQDSRRLLKYQGPDAAGLGLIQALEELGIEPFASDSVEAYKAAVIAEHNGKLKAYDTAVRQKSIRNSWVELGAKLVVPIQEGWKYKAAVWVTIVAVCWYFFGAKAGVGLPLGSLIAFVAGLFAADKWWVGNVAIPDRPEPFRELQWSTTRLEWYSRNHHVPVPILEIGNKIVARFSDVEVTVDFIGENPDPFLAVQELSEVVDSMGRESKVPVGLRHFVGVWDELGFMQTLANLKLAAK